MTDKPKRAALYLRVSTGEQTTDNQRQALQDEATRRGWSIAHVYEDAGISGAKGRDKRPGLHAALTDATRGRYDVLMAWSVDRLGRSLPDLINTLVELKGASVDLYLQQQAIDTSTPAGRMVYQMLGVIAEFERELIKARVSAGLARAKKQGKRLGRRRLGTERDESARNEAKEKIRTAEKMLKNGSSIYSVIKSTGLGSGTVQKMAKDIRI